MRRSIATVIPLVAALAGAACEDGPSQTFTPAPTGAGTVWNGTPGGGGIPGDSGIFVPPATQSYDAQVGGQNANQTFTPVQLKAIWSSLFSAPLQPPGLAGGIDIAGGANGDCRSGYVSGQPFVYNGAAETWVGCTLDTAEKILGQATADSIYSGITNTAGWGESLELSAYYNTSSREITDLLIEYGYVGTTTAKSTDGKSTYTISMNNIPISCAGTCAATGPTWTLDWANVATLNAQVNAYYDAMRNTFQPSFPADTDCVGAGHCIIGNDENQGGYIWLTPLNFTFYVDTTVGTPSANSIPVLIDIGLLRVLPFSGASTLLKLDSAGQGPVTTQAGLGAPSAPRTCNYVLGMTFADFDTNCLSVFPASYVDSNGLTGTQLNATAKAKLFGGVSHGDESFDFDTSGVDPQFVAASLGPTSVISDTVLTDAGTTVCNTDASECLPTDTATPQDVAFELELDQELLGVISNDFTNNDPTKAKDYHGIGLVTLEWANLIQKYMQANYGVTSDLGDPACIKNPLRPTTGSTDAGASDAASDAAPPPPAKICSGIEGIVTSAPPASVTGQMKVNALGANAVSVDPTLAVGLKPGTWYSIFCSGSGNPATGTGYSGCIGGEKGYNGGSAYFFDTMQDALSNAYGGGGYTQLPAELQDRTFVFEEFVLAYVKYLQSADDPNATLATIDANVVDPNEIFFDSNGGGFVTSEYVDRSHVNALGQAPTVVDVTVQLETSIMNDFNFGRWNFRGETALYTALKDKSTDKPGAEPLFLSNIVGSPVLAATYGTYTCANNSDPLNGACGHIVPPQDPVTGKSLYQPYSDAFGQSFLNIAAYGAAPIASPMTVNPNGFELILSAQLTIPVLSNPYDQSSAPVAGAGGSITELVQYLPAGSAGAGFPVTIDGSRDKVYNTNQVFISGESVDGTIDYEYVGGFEGADGGATTGLVVRAFESENYLGLVFACAEPNPTNPDGPKDILAVRMAENGNDLLSWIAQHPGATSDCGVEIRYSPYGNYPDYISFLLNGVRFGLNPGFGGSVVTDCTIFDPNVIATLGQ